MRSEISPIATPDKLQFVAGLPKTRSGKIMRRILRKVAEGNPDDVGDVTTLAEPHVVEAIIEGASEAHWRVAFALFCRREAGAMAIIDTLRLRNALVRGGIAQDEPACELVDIVDDEFSKLATNFVTRESHEASEHRVLAAIADLGRRAAERDAERAREAEQRAHEAAERDAARADREAARAQEAAERDAARAREAEQRAREAAERDRQIHNHITIGIGLIIGAITIATAVISIVIVVLG